MRQFTRYSTDIPINIEISSNEPKVVENCKMTSISLGGLCCDIDYSVAVGCKVNIRIPSVLPPFYSFGEVTWCQPKDGLFEIGVSFIRSEDVITSRMVQQVCQIEHYKTIVFDREGKILDGKQAAEQWIEKYTN